MIGEHLRVMAHNLAAAITAGLVRGTTSEAQEDLVALPIHLDALADEARALEYPSNVVRLHR